MGEDNAATAQSNNLWRRSVTVGCFYSALAERRYRFRQTLPLPNRPAIFQRWSARNCHLIVEANRARRTLAFPSAILGAIPPRSLQRYAMKKRFARRASFRE